MEERSLFDFWYWDSDDTDPTSLKGNTPASLYAFLQQNGGARRSLLQVYDLKDEEWVDMLCSIDEAYIWDVLMLDRDNPSSWTEPIATGLLPFKFLYYDGSSVMSIPVASFVSADTLEVKARFSLDYASFLATNNHVGYASCVAMDAIISTVYFANPDAAEFTTCEKNRPFSATFNIPSGYSASDISSMELVYSGQNDVEFTYGSEFDVAVQDVPDIDVVGSDEGRNWFSTHTIAQSFTATRSMLDSISFKARGFTDDCTFIASVYPEIILPGAREVTKITFPVNGYLGIYDGSYMVIESSSRSKWLFWFDQWGDEDWQYLPSFNTADYEAIIQVNLWPDFPLYTAGDVAAGFIAACETDLEAAGFGVVDNLDGSVSITHDSVGVVPHISMYMAPGSAWNALRSVETYGTADDILDTTNLITSVTYRAPDCIMTGDWVSMVFPGGAALSPNHRYAVQIINQRWGADLAIEFSRSIADPYSGGEEYAYSNGNYEVQSAYDTDVLMHASGLDSKVVVITGNSITASFTSGGSTIPAIDWSTNIPALLTDLGGGIYSISGFITSTITLSNRMRLPVRMDLTQALNIPVQLLITYTKWEQKYVSSLKNVKDIEICDVSGDNENDVFLGRTGYYSNNELRGDNYKLRLTYTGTENKVSEEWDIAIDRLNPEPKFIIDSYQALRLTAGSETPDKTWIYMSFSKMSGDLASTSARISFKVLPFAGSGTFYVLVNDLHGSPEPATLTEIIQASHVALKFSGGTIYYFSNDAWFSCSTYGTDGSTWTTIMIEGVSTSQFKLQGTLESMQNDIDSLGFGVIEFIGEQSADVLIDDILTGWGATSEYFSAPLVPGDSILEERSWSAVNGWYGAENSGSIVRRFYTDDGPLQISGVHQFTVQIFSTHISYMNLEYAAYGTTDWQIINIIYSPATHIWLPVWDSTPGSITYAPEGQYIMKITAVNENGLVGSDTVVVLVDRTPPTLGTLVISPAQVVATNLVSKRARYSLTVTDANALQPLRCEILNIAGTLRIGGLEIPVLAGQATFSLGSWWENNPIFDAVLLRLVAKDRASNIAMVECLLVKDTTANIVLAGAAAGTTLKYGDMITGDVVDSFGEAVEEEVVDVYINDYFYGRTRTNDAGEFALPFTTLDTYSEDMLSLGSVSTPGSSWTAFHITDFLFWEAQSESTFSTGIYLIQKPIFSDSLTCNDPVIRIAPTDKLISLPPDISGFAFDLVIPDVYSEFWQTCTFESITIEFADKAGFIFTYTVDQKALYEQFTDANAHPESQQFMLGSDSMRRIRVFVPMAMIETSHVDLAAMSTVTITGKSFSIYAGDILDVIENIALYQYLGLMNMRAVRSITPTFDISFSLPDHDYVVDVSGATKAACITDFNAASDIAEASTSISSQPGAVVECSTGIGTDGAAGYLRIAGGNPGAASHTSSDDSAILLPVFGGAYEHPDYIAISVRVPALYDGKVRADITFKDDSWQSLVDISFVVIAGEGGVTTGMIDINKEVAVPYVAGTWYKLEFFIDWDSKTLSCKVNSVVVLTSSSYTASRLSSIAMYTRNPGVPYVQNIEFHADNLVLSAQGLSKAITVVPISTVLDATMNARALATYDWVTDDGAINPDEFTSTTDAVTFLPAGSVMPTLLPTGESGFPAVSMPMGSAMQVVVTTSGIFNPTTPVDLGYPGVAIAVHQVTGFFKVSFEFPGQDPATEEFYLEVSDAGLRWYAKYNNYVWYDRIAPWLVTRPESHILRFYHDYPDNIFYAWIGSEAGAELTVMWDGLGGTFDYRECTLVTLSALAELQVDGIQLGASWKSSATGSMVYSDILDASDATVSAAVGGVPMEITSLRLSVVGTSRLYTRSGAEVIHRQITSGCLQVIGTPGTYAAGLELVYPGNAFFAPSILTLLPGASSITINKEKAEFVVNTDSSSDLKTLVDESGQKTYKLDITYGSGNLVGGTGLLVDDDLHNIIYPFGQIDLVQIPLYHFDPNAQQWIHPSAIKNDAIGNLLIGYGLAQSFTPSTPSITSVALYTSNHDLPNELESIDIYLYGFDENGQIKVGTPLQHRAIHGSEWGTDQAGWRYFDLNCNNLIPGTTYVVAFTGTCRNPVSGYNELTLIKASTTTGSYAGGCAYQMAADGTWAQLPTIDMTFMIDPYIKGAHALVQLLVNKDNDGNPTNLDWTDWQVMELGINGEFGFLVDASVSRVGGTLVVPLSFLPPGAYAARLVYPSTPDYEAAELNFDIIVSGAQTRIDFVQSLAKSQATTLKSEYKDEGRTYDDEWFALEDGKPWTYLELATTYGDKAEFTFILTEAATGLPIGNAPLFMEVSLVPNSVGWNEDYFADAYADYLYNQDPYISPGLDMLPPDGIFLQGKYEKPITYPFLDSNLEWTRWGAMAWTCAVTSNDPANKGEATFTFDKGFLVRNLIQDAQDILKETVNELADVKLYVRVFYSTSVVLADMALNDDDVAPVYPAEPADPLPPGTFPDTVFSQSDIPGMFNDDLDGDGDIDGFFGPSVAAGFTNDGSGSYSYMTQDRENTYAEGFIVVEKEEILMAGGYTEGLAMDETGFDVSIAILEADTVPGEDGGLVPEQDGLQLGWFDDFSLPGNELFAYLEIWDSTSSQQFTQYPMYATTDSSSTVTFTISPATLGGNWDYMLPGFYKGYAYTSGNRYVKGYPQAEEYYDFDIVIKSPNSYNLSRPSYEYQFDYAMDTEEGVNAFYTEEDPRTKIIAISGFGTQTFIPQYVVISIPDSLGVAAYGFCSSIPTGRHWTSLHGSNKFMFTSAANLASVITGCTALNDYGIVASASGTTVTLMCKKSFQVVAYADDDTVEPVLMISSDHLPSITTDTIMASGIPRIRGEVVVIEEGTINELDEDIVETDEDLPLYDGIEMTVSVNGLDVKVERIEVPNPEPAPVYLSEDFYDPVLKYSEFEFSLRPFIGQKLDSLKIAFASLNHLADKRVYLTKLVMDDGLDISDGELDIWDLLGEIITVAPTQLHDNTEGTSYTFNEDTSTDTGSYTTDLMHEDKTLSTYGEYEGKLTVNSLTANFQIDRDTDIDIDHADVVKAITIQRQGKTFVIDRAVMFTHKDKDTTGESLDYSSIEFVHIFSYVDSGEIVSRAIAPRFLTPAARNDGIDYLSGCEKNLGFGFQFMSIGTNDLPHGFTDSVRHAKLDLDGNDVDGDGIDRSVETLYMKPGKIGSQALFVISGTSMRFADVYIPFRPSITGTLAVPVLSELTTVQVRFTINMVQVDAPWNDATWYYDVTAGLGNPATSIPVTLPLNITYNYGEDPNGYSPASGSGLGGLALAAFIGKTADITLSIDVLGDAATRLSSWDLAHAHWIDVRLRGWENFATVSTGLPQESTRAKIFSNRFLNFFATNVDSTMGLTMQTGMTPEVDSFELAQIPGTDSLKSIAKVLGLGDHRDGPLDLSSPDWDLVIVPKFRYEAGTRTETSYNVPDTKAIFLQSLIFPEDRDKPDYEQETKYYEGQLLMTPHGAATPERDFSRKISILIRPFHELRFNTFYHFSVSSTVDDIEAAKIVFDDEDGDGDDHPLPLNEHDVDGSGVVDDDESNIEDLLVVSYRKPLAADASAATISNTDDFAITDWGVIYETGVPSADFLTTHTVYEADRFYLRRTWELFNWAVSSPAPPAGHAVYDEEYRSGNMLVTSASVSITPKSDAWKTLFGVASGSAIDWTKFGQFGFELFINESIDHVHVYLKYGEPAQPQYEWVEADTDGTGIICSAHAIALGSAVTEIKIIAEAKTGYTGSLEFGIGSLLFERTTSKILLRATYTDMSGVKDLVADYWLPATTPFADWNRKTTCFTLPATAANLSALAIVNPAGSTTIRTLDVSRISVLTQDSSSGDVLGTIYDYEFSEDYAETMDLYADLGVPGASLAKTFMESWPWEIDGTVPSPSVKQTIGSTSIPYSDEWLFVEAYDFDLSGSMDVVYEITDTKGQPVFEWDVMLDVDNNPNAVFDTVDDGTDVLYSTDSDGNGVFESEVFITTAEKEMPDTSRKVGYQRQIEYVELRMDEDQDGQFEYITYQQRDLLSAPCDLEKITYWSTTDSDWASTPWDYDGRDCHHCIERHSLDTCGGNLFLLN
nr:hypothetical protein [Candidatus Sigynarchaeota archaeon]